MPTTYIPKIGDVEYTSTDLPEGIKGKTLLGILDAPIKITERLEPSAKTDYIVAHEVGHRLTYDMIVNAYNESPILFQEAPNPLSGLVRYFIDLGLKKEDIDPLHPGTEKELSNIFIQNKVGKWTDELVAQEFIAEVFANWATNRGHIPETIGKRFKALVASKNAILGIPTREAAFGAPAVISGESSKSHEALVVVGLAALAVYLIMNIDKVQGK